MSGIYLHIPFCKQACHYCDFHFSTNLKNKSEMVRAMLSEIEMRKDYLADPVRSIYFGGGTPSILDTAELELLIDGIHKNFQVVSDLEITLEANPDDLSKKYLESLIHTPVNRLSIGVQTFDDDRLKFINRAHTSKEAIGALQTSLDVGFENITADLIYAIPPTDLSYWENDLKKMLSFNLPHLSLYGLTVEEKTVFGNWRKKGKLKETDDEVSAQQYQLAMDILQENGYEHYEVSNFARNNMYSRHNSAYWDDQTYLGIGPGAHSYNGEDRGFNVSHNQKYLQEVSKKFLPLTIEKLTPIDRLNEYIFTHLRTKKGIDLATIQSRFGKFLMQDYGKEIKQFVSEGYMLQSEKGLSLTSKGFMIADEISLRLFYED